MPKVKQKRGRGRPKLACSKRVHRPRFHRLPKEQVVVIVIIIYYQTAHKWAVTPRLFMSYSYFLGHFLLSKPGFGFLKESKKSIGYIYTLYLLLLCMKENLAISCYLFMIFPCCLFFTFEAICLWYILVNWKT